MHNLALSLSLSLSLLCSAVDGQHATMAAVASSTCNSALSRNYSAVLRKSFKSRLGGATSPGASMSLHQQDRAYRWFNGTETLPPLNCCCCQRANKSKERKVKRLSFLVQKEEKWRGKGKEDKSFVIVIRTKWIPISSSSSRLYKARLDGAPTTGQWERETLLSTPRRRRRPSIVQCCTICAIPLHLPPKIYFIKKGARTHCSVQ